MKKIISFCLFLVLLLVMTGCSNANNTADPDTNFPDAAQTPSNTVSTPEEKPLTGTVETFTRGNLVLEVSNVCEVRTESKLAEGIEPYEETIFTCCPGATLTVVNADMSDPAYTEDHQAHPQWGLYDVETDARTKLTDETAPIVLDETTDAVFHLEASLFLLVFEFTE